MSRRSDLQDRYIPAWRVTYVTRYAGGGHDGFETVQFATPVDRSQYLVREAELISLYVPPDVYVDNRDVHRVVFHRDKGRLSADDALAAGWITECPSWSRIKREPAEVEG